MMRDKNKSYFEAIVIFMFAAAVVAVVAYGIAWYNKKPPIPAGMTVQAIPAPEIKAEPKMEIKPVSVKVYRHAVKGKLKLPELVANDSSQYVIASNTTANDERPHTITTTINQSTGDIQTFDRTDPLPWMAINTKSEVGIYYGVKHGEQAIRIEGRQELLQIKTVHLGAIASADMTRAGADTFIGIGAWARW